MIEPGFSPWSLTGVSVVLTQNKMRDEHGQMWENWAIYSLERLPPLPVTSFLPALPRSCKDGLGWMPICITTSLSGFSPTRIIPDPQPLGKAILV